MRSIEDARVCVVGLGYVGLPLAVAFGREFDTVGFDIDAGRVDELRRGRDRTGETSAEELASATRLALTSDAAAIEDRNVYVITVPTPVDEATRPDLRPLEAASALVGGRIRPGDVVVYESTVYPGTTEEVCVPILERASGLAFGTDFHVGYSPERINPGDRARRLPDIMKVTSGSSPEAAAFVDALYRRIVPAGTHLAPSIKVAEAAKVIENTQRDLNIALVNELAMIFHTMGIDTQDVLAAAGTKWNFLPFRPGLVGGHCIGVDPYYLTHKATVLGYHPELILTARRINSRMGLYVAHEVLRLMARKRIHAVDSRILVLGVTFKEDCPDLRNTRVVEVIHELQAANARVEAYDPVADAAQAKAEVGDAWIEAPTGTYDAIVLAVPHATLLRDGADGVLRHAKPDCVVYDVKGALPAGRVDGRL
ncbi:Vi polysaccharide biosynthesis UDP-N-acetylglucosamine C-6 dehydrogenase TviB [Luteimonas pelagia]